MADITSQTFTGTGTGTKSGQSFWEKMGAWMELYAKTNSRLRELERLTNLTDAELAKEGLTRDGIPRHVFRDIYYI